MTHEEMIAQWDEHIGYEFSTRDVASTIATMVEDAYVNHVPVLTGGAGKSALCSAARTGSRINRRPARASTTSPARPMPT